LHLFNYSTDSDGTTWNRTRFCGYRFYKTKKTVSSIYLRKNTGTYTSPGSFQSTEAASKTLILDNAANLTNIRTLDVKLNASNSTYSHPTEALIKLENNSHNYISFRTQTDTGAHSGLVFSDNNRGGYITFQTYVGSGTNDGTNGDSMFLGAYNDIVFQTGGSNTIAGKTERFRIKQNGNIDSTFFDASGTSARFTMQQNAESELQLYNNRQDLSNVPVSSIVGYNASQVAKLIFYRGGGSSSGYIKLQTKSHNDLSLTDVATFGGNSSNGTTANTDSTFHGNISHQGLTMSTGTDVDQVKSYNMTFQLAANTWTDTGINGSDLSTGTYAMQVYIDDHNAGGGHYEEHYSAMISWFAGGTNSGDRQDEIVVHRAGHAPNNSDVQFRTQRHSSGGDNLMLQVKQNFAHTTTMNNTDGRQFNFKFRRLI
jgi:hypothetical protein